MPIIRRVAVLIETSRGYGRGLIRGVIQYCREHGHWTVFFKPQGLDEFPPPWLKDWKGDGILARIANRKVADAILKTGLPTIDLRGTMADLGLPYVGADERKVAQLAFNHLRELGLRHFAFCGLRPGENVHNDERCAQFLAQAEAAGFSCEAYQAMSLLRRSGSWEEDQRKLALWIESLPKPVGIMACSDDFGLELLDACRLAGIHVPQQAALISVDNDEYLCMLSMPPMSSIDIAPQRIGYEAAALLDRMMNGQRTADKCRLLPPGDIVVRQSTNVMVIGDPLIHNAVRFIREHAHEPITLDDVARHVGVSRAKLKSQSKEVLGYTLHHEIQRVRIEKVKDLLSSELPLKQIARHCGFKYTQYMARVFRQATGETLVQFRKRKKHFPI